MKIRIKFAKYGAMKFIGHLDVMRFFQKVFRRAGIDISFSEGMSPHMILSFAAPLGLGAEGMSEYADIQINTAIEAEEALRRMNEVSVEGIEFLDFRSIPDGKATKAMSLVAAADYAVRFRKGHEVTGHFASEQEWKKAWADFLAQPSVMITKKTKKGTKEAEIRPMIIRITQGIPFAESLAAARKDCGIYAEREDGSPILYMRLATGSEANLKPEQVMEAFAAFAGFQYDPLAAVVTRLDLYTRTEDKLVSLGEC